MYSLIDDNYLKYATTYDIDITGTHGNNKVHTTDGLRDLIDEFCIDYYKANKNK